MKKITLIRHAESTWKIPGMADYDRPLSGRGIRNLALMGTRLESRRFAAEQIISSSALRTLETARQLVDITGLPHTSLIVEPRLYLADYKRLIDWIRGLDSKWHWVGLVGHNPGITEVAKRLSGRPIGNVPTCGIVEMNFDVDNWREIDCGRLLFFSFDAPKKR